VPSCVTFASTISKREFEESVIDIKYFALLKLVALKVFRTEVLELETVVVASAIADTLKVAPAVAKAKVPAPSVFKNCPELPSDVGNVNPLIVTEPDPFPDNSKFELDAFVEIELSEIVTPSITAEVVADKVVKVPASGVVPPITVLSMLPPSMSAVDITTLPDPDGDIIRSLLLAVALITLSVILIFESIVRLLIITDPDPPGSIRISAFESDEIILSLKFKLSMLTVPASETAPDTVNAVTVVAPKFAVPVVEIFSSPKLILPPESVIDPFAKVRLPIVEPEPAVIVPVVLKFSLPKLIAPEESVIEPSAIVIFPNVDPVAAVTVPVTVVAPETFKVPSTISPSLILMVDESAELNVVPAIPIDPKVTVPVPDGTKFMLSLVLVASILFPLILKAGNTTPPVPAGSNTISSFDLVAVMLFPEKLIAPNTTLPVPFGIKLMSSFDLVPSILLSLILIAGNNMPPVPDGSKIKSSFVLLAFISLPLMLMPSLNKGDAYRSVKLLLTLIIASRSVSPVPSFAFCPTLSILCVIIPSLSF